MSPKKPGAAWVGGADWKDSWASPQGLGGEINGVLGAVRPLLAQGCKGGASDLFSPQPRCRGDGQQAGPIAEGQGCERLGVNEPSPETGSTGNLLLGGLEGKEG